MEMMTTLYLTLKHMTLVKNMTSNQANSHHVSQDCSHPNPPGNRAWGRSPLTGPHHTAPHRPTAIPVTAACPSAQAHSSCFNTSERETRVEPADITELVKWRSTRCSSPNPQPPVTGRREAQCPASGYCFIMNPGCDK